MHPLQRGIGKNILRTVVQDDEILIEFIGFVCRIEYALKRAEFARMTNGRISIDWNRFAQTIEPAFWQTDDQRLPKAIEYFVNSPPMKQVIRDKQLVWVTSSVIQGNPQLADLLVLVRRVRNNLFHGGKFPTEVVRDTARNQTLMISSIVILEGCLAAAHEAGTSVYAYFVETD